MLVMDTVMAVTDLRIQWNKNDVNDGYSNGSYWPLASMKQKGWVATWKWYAIMRIQSKHAEFKTNT